MSPPRPLVTVLHIVAAALAGYAILLGLLWWGQSGMVFLPEVPGRAVETTPAAAGLEFEPLRLETDDGVTLAGWFVPGPAADGPVVLFLHGNAGNIGHRIDTLDMLHAAGAASLIIDYRGYGDSSGRPGEPGTYRDAHTAWRWLVAERGIEPGRIVVFGRSLGGAIAAWLAAQERPGGLILEAAFTSINELGQHHYPWAPVALLSRFRYTTERYLADVACPVLVAHARADEVVPYAHGERLAALRPPVVEFLTLDGGHNDAMFASRDRYTEELRRFIGQVTAPVAAQ